MTGKLPTYTPLTPLLYTTFGNPCGFARLSSHCRRSACLCRLLVPAVAKYAPSAQANRPQTARSCRQTCAFGASQPPADRPQLSPNMRLRRVRFASAIAAAPRSGRESIERTPEPEHHQGCSRSMVTAGVRHSLQRAGNICPHLALKSASHCSEHRKRTTAPLSTRSAPIYAVNRLVSCI